MTTTLRPDLPPLPWRLKHRPIERGYPVPWFVAEIDGRYDFRITATDKIAEAVRYRVCWVCGQPLGRFLTFNVGPMCTITRTISEPPSHRECATWSALACPFLNNHEKRRNESNLPLDLLAPDRGYPIKRQPGVCCVWVTRSYQPFQAPGGVLFQIGSPIAVEWYREGRQATRAEVMASIESGYPVLLEMAQEDGPQAVKELEAARDRALALLPEE